MQNYMAWQGKLVLAIVGMCPHSCAFKTFWPPNTAHVELVGCSCFILWELLSLGLALLHCFWPIGLCLCLYNFMFVRYPPGTQSDWMPPITWWNCHLLATSSCFMCSLLSLFLLLVRAMWIGWTSRMPIHSLCGIWYDVIPPTTMSLAPTILLMITMQIGDLLSRLVANIYPFSIFLSSCERFFISWRTPSSFSNRTAPS